MSMEEYITMGREMTTWVAAIPQRYLLISDEYFSETLLVGFLYSLIPITVFGVLANTANIFVFYRMGFAVTSNISLFVLAISDLVCVFHILAVSIAYSPMIYNMEFWVRPNQIIEIIVQIFHCSSAFGSWVTAIINVERSCCVVIPMKVKMIFTRKTIIWLLIGMLIFQLSGIPHFFTRPLRAFVSPKTNRTIYLIDIEGFNNDYVAYSVLVSYSIPTFICFFVVVVGTIFLVIKFQQSMKVREAMSGKTEAKKSVKDAKVTRSVIAICTLYIIGNFLNVGIFVGSSVVPNFHYFDPYFRGLFKLVSFLGYLVQAIACSVNIFIYWQMSSKFKQTFKRLFSC